MMSKRRKYEKRAGAVLRRTGHTVDAELAIDIMLQVDFDLGVVTASEFFGPLTETILGHRVLVEHFRGRPKRGHAARVATKAAAMAVESGTLGDMRPTCDDRAVYERHWSISAHAFG